MKKCKICNVRKPYTDFYKREKTKDGHRNDCKECFAERGRENHLKRMYDITHEHYLYILEQQEGCCKICNKEAKEERNGVLRVDHNHNTGTVRGLLCDNCNRFLGFAGDNPEILLKGYQYLKENGHYGA